MIPSCSRDSELSLEAMFVVLLDLAAGKRSGRQDSSSRRGKFLDLAGQRYGPAIIGSSGPVSAGLLYNVGSVW